MAPLTYAAWMDAAEEEYRRLDVLLRDLSAREWALPTDCEGWAVRDVVAHLVGAAESCASLRELLRQARLGRRLAPDAATLVDAINALQVAERAQVPADRLVADLATAGTCRLRTQRRVPAAVRRVPLPFGPPLGVRPLGYLLGCIYTRDAWLHRVDLSRATGRRMELTPGHDGAIVGDVVAEWVTLHDEPFLLELDGPAGGTWQRGTTGEHLRLDAVEFCRMLSGRVPATGLLAHPVPF